MTKTLLPALVGLLLLAGCSHGYVLTLNNGDRVRAASKPRLVNGFYYYKDSSGREGRPVFSGGVREIAPASMASEDTRTTFKPAQLKP